MTDTRERILDVAVDILGANPDAGMGEIAAAAGVVRRTVYGHFPSRADLVRALTDRAVSEISAVLTASDDSEQEADEAWADFIAGLWPMAHRYRVLVALRRGEFGESIHSALGPIEKTLTDLVRRGQNSGAFPRHLPADILGQSAWSGVFALADLSLSRGQIGTTEAIMASLLSLGVPEPRAKALVER